MRNELGPSHPVFKMKEEQEFSKEGRRSRVFSSEKFEAEETRREPPGFLGINWKTKIFDFLRRIVTEVVAFSGVLH